MATNGQLVFTDVDKVTFKGVGNTSNAVIDTTTGKIGVGVDSPDANLHVVGNCFVSTNFELGGTMTMGTVTVRAQHELSAITATGNTTPHTVEFQNATTGFVTTANIEVGTANLFVDTSTSNVGIGTNAPIDTLHINGGTRFAGHIIPTTNATFDIGSAENKVRDLYVDTNSIWVGDRAKIAFENGKMKFKRRKLNKVPRMLVNLAINHGRTDEADVETHAIAFAQTKDPTISTVSDLKLEHLRDYAKTFDETKAVSDIFADNEEDYEAITASEAFMEVGSNIFTEHSLSIGKTTDPSAKMDIYTGSTGTAALSFDRYATGNYRTDIYQNTYGPDFRVGYAANTPESVLYLKRLSDGTKEVEINGNVGIGTTDPETALDVSGTVKSTHVSLGTSLNPTIGGNWVTIKNDTYDGDMGDNHPNPEGGLLFANQSSSNRFPWGYYMGVVKDVASPSSTSIRFDIGKSLDLNTNGGTGGTDTLTPYLTIDDGNVGIGTTDPLNILHLSSDNASLDASGSATFDQYSLIIHNTRGSGSGGTEMGLCFNHYDGSYPSSTRTPGAAITHERTDSWSKGKLHFKTKSGNTEAGTCDTRMTIDESGNVGIGTTTMTEKLTVNGNLDFTPVYGNQGNSNKSGMIIFNKPPGESIDTSTNIDAIYYDDATNRYHFTQDTTKYASGNAGLVCGEVKLNTLHFNESAGTIAKINLTEGNELDIYSDFKVRFFESDANAEKITFDLNNGFVGINNTSPDKHLVIGTGAATSAQFSVDTSTASHMIVGNEFGSSHYLDLVSMGSININLDSNNNDTDKVIDFRKDTRTNGGSLLMRIRENGRVGIGTSSPEEKLHVQGQIRMASQRAIGGSYNSYLTWPNSGHHIDCYKDGSGHNFHINHYALQPVYLNRHVYSDRRIKEDIKDIDDVSALDTLRKIKPKTYKYKLQPHKGTVYGFIAQDVREVLPYATSLTKLSAPFDRENFVNATILEDGTVNLDGPCNELEIGKNAYFYYESSTSTRDFEVTEIISPTQFSVRVGDDSSEWIGNTILIGKEVDDFHGIDKDAIFTVATAALQEVDRQQQADKVRISELETQLETERIRNDALEARILALENA